MLATAHLSCTARRQGRRARPTARPLPDLGSQCGLPLLLHVTASSVQRAAFAAVRSGKEEEASS